MPRPSNTQERRREIALALARVMARTGYERATVSAIAAEAGVAAGGVHYHFGSKAEILVDLVERLVRTAEERIDARLEQAHTARDELAAVLEALLGVGEDADADAVALWSLVAAEAIRNDEVRELYARWVAAATDRLRRALMAACREERRRGTGTAAMAAALMALVEGYYSVAAGAPEVIPPGSAAPTARQIALAFVDAQPRAAR